MPPRTVISDYQSNPFLNTSAFKPSSEVSYRFGESRGQPVGSNNSISGSSTPMGAPSINPGLTMPPVQTSFPVMQFNGCDVDMGVSPTQQPNLFGGFSSAQHNIASSSTGFGGNSMPATLSPNLSNPNNCIAGHNSMSPVHGNSSLGQMQAAFSPSSMNFGQNSSIPTFQQLYNPLSFSQTNYTPQTGSFITNAPNYSSPASVSKGSGFSLGIISGTTNKRGRK